MCQEGPCRTFGKLSTRAHSDGVSDFQHIASAVELDYEVLVDDDEGGLQVAQHLAGPPLLGVGDARLECLLRVLIHNSLQPLHEGESISQRPSKPTVYVIRQLPYLPPIDLHPCVPVAHLSVADYHCLSIAFQG